MQDNMLTANGCGVWLIMEIIDPATPLHRLFFAPALAALEASTRKRVCLDYSDADFLELGVTRVLMQCQSGRDLIQRLGLLRDNVPGRSNFFEALKSSRRLGLREDVGTLLRASCAARLPDVLRQFPELAGYDVYAADGHSHRAASHDARVDGQKVAVTHLYARNLRDGWLTHLSACPLKEKGNHHEMAVLQSLSGRELRQGAKKGRKVIYVYDRAVLDLAQWFTWKQGSGIYIITRSKDTLVLGIQSLREFERDIPLNANVLRDEVVTAATSPHPLRRVVFWDEIGGESYEFLTNEMTLPPGLIAHLYRMRWEIEKSFDEFKNKLGEKKAWGSSAVARDVQAQFICLAENLLLLLRHHLEKTEGLRNEAEIRRRQRRLEEATEKVTASGGVIPLALRELQHLTQNSVKFIRWVATLLHCHTPWKSALNRLRSAYAVS